MFIKLAIRNLARNKRRTLITAASVFFAVFFAILMRSLQLGVYDNMINNIVGYYHGYGQVMHQDYWEEASLDNTLLDTPEFRDSLLQISGVANVLPRVQTYALASAGEISKGVLVTGIQPESEHHILNIEPKLIKGQYFSAKDQSVILGEKLAEFMSLAVGDTLILLGQGFQGASAAGKFNVAGIARFSSPDLSNTLVCLPIQAAQQMYAAEGRLSYYILHADRPNQIENALADINNTLPKSKVAKSWKEILPELIQLIQADNAAGKVALGILYIIIGFGMFGTILMMTTERLYEFGVLISIGMKRWKLICIQVVEGILVSFIGVIAGAIFSVPVLLWFYNNPIHLGADLAEFGDKYNIEPVLHFSLAPEIFYMQALWVLAMAIIVNWYPVWKISSLKVVQALRA